MQLRRGLLALTLCLSVSVAHAVPVSFTGTNTGAIPDNNPAGRTVSFAVSGLTAPLGSVQLSMTLTHPWMGDLSAVLIAPGGAARLVVFGRVGATRTNANGDSSDFGGVYVFSDLGGPELWPAAAAVGAAVVLTPGTYRTTSTGSPGRSSVGGCPTSLRGVFAGLSAAQANGTWTLVVSDGAAPDAGVIDAATLTLDTASAAIFANGFEDPGVAAAPQPLGLAAPSYCINKPWADLTGDGLADFILTRSVGSAIEWRIRENLGNGTAGVTETIFNFGNPATDNIDLVDADGDRIADPTVWTRGTPGTFTTRLSSRGGALRATVLGSTGADPFQSGDYDGDAIDDYAVYQAPASGSPDGPMTVSYVRSSDGVLRTLTVGNGVTGDQFLISGFDVSGDGLADIVLQEADTTTPTAGRFRYINAATGAQFSTFLHGNSSDFLIPGNFVGSAYWDATVRRTVSGLRNHESRDSQTGVVAPVVTFGVTGDTSLGGDYDGDGITDIGVWHPSSTAAEVAFQIRPSSNTAITWSINYGQAGDFAVSGSRVH